MTTPIAPAPWLPRLALACVPLVLSACGGGGDTAPTAREIHADNMVEVFAIGSAELAQSQWVQQLWPLAAIALDLGAGPGTAACPGGGRYTYERQGLRGRLSFDDCRTHALHFVAGSITLTETASSTDDWDLGAEQLVIARAGDAGSRRTLTASLSHRASADGRGYANTGSYSVVRNGRTDQITLQASYRIEQLDTVPLRIDLGLRTPRFAPALALSSTGTAATAALSVTSAGDASSVTGSALDGGATLLTLRAAATGAPVATKTLSAAELDAAIRRVD